MTEPKKDLISGVMLNDDNDEMIFVCKNGEGFLFYSREFTGKNSFKIFRVAEAKNIYEFYQLIFNGAVSMFCDKISIDAIKDLGIESPHELFMKELCKVEGYYRLGYYDESCWNGKYNQRIYYLVRIIEKGHISFGTVLHPQWDMWDTEEERPHPFNGLYWNNENDGSFDDWASFFNKLVEGKPVFWNCEFETVTYASFIDELKKVDSDYGLTFLENGLLSKEYKDLIQKIRS